MNTPKPSARRKRGAAAKPRPRGSHGRQRQRLIDACISALHIHGPSQTTVEKVVAIARMSPGIVRFYFDSKAAMLVASLQFLAAEFEERLLVPVSGLIDKPVAALELLVNLYLDPEIASARKVSVWYSFWGEASSRQEYYDICGQKDERFERLVQALIQRLIVDTAQPQLDADAVALGLIGVLEMLWQRFAFQTEATIDRPAAKARAMAYLSSIFPGRFTAVTPAFAVTQTPAASAEPGLPGQSYADARLNRLEREQLFDGTWQHVGHQAQIAARHAYLRFDTSLERLLILRDADGEVRALRNCCPVQPHALITAMRGTLGKTIDCPQHGLRLRLDDPALSSPPIAVRGDLLFVQVGAAHEGAPVGWLAPERGDALTGGAAPAAFSVAADWKIVVEQWLEQGFPEGAATGAAEDWDFPELKIGEEGRGIEWHARLKADPRRWTAQRYRSLAAPARPSDWRRRFMPPNQLLESRFDGMTIWQVDPLAAGRSRVLRFDYGFAAAHRNPAALRYLGLRLARHEGRRARSLMESLQQGLVDYRYPSRQAGVRGRARAAFDGWLKQRIRHYNWADTNDRS